MIQKLFFPLSLSLSLCTKRCLDFLLESPYLDLKRDHAAFRHQNSKLHQNPRRRPLSESRFSKLANILKHTFIQRA